MLAAYFDGLLSDEQEDSLHAVAANCPDCQERLVSLAVTLKATDVVPEAFTVPSALTAAAVALFSKAESKSSMLRLAVRWLEGALAPVAEALQPLHLPAPVTRGMAPSGVEKYEDLRFNVTLGSLPVAIELEVDGLEELALTVRPLSQPPSGVLLRLSSGGETRAISSLSHAGATVSSLEPGSYQLKLEQASQTVGEITIELLR
jgi:hypothetical protein